MTMTINDDDVQRLIADANRGAVPDEPDIAEPLDTVGSLAAGYLQEDGQWAKTFEVRELTGRDEEALSRITDVGRSLVVLIERGLVRLGNDSATVERLDSLVGGDWDTILLKVRAVTFGPNVELTPTCQGCGTKYEVTVNVLSDLTVRTVNPADLSWTLKGKRSTYEVSLYTGGTQRKIFELMADGATIATINTEALRGSIDRIDGRVPLGRDDILNIPMSDRRAILDSIQERRVGPDLQEVKIKCPTCGHEQSNPLNAAALFQ